MTSHVVFFRRLSDEQREKVNASGWSSNLGSAYLDSEGNRHQAPCYEGAIEFDLFEVAAVVRDADDIELLWSRMQNRGPSWSCEPTVKALTDFPRSMSAGDVVYSVEQAKWHYAAIPFGFKTVDDTAFVAYLMTKIHHLGLTATPPLGTTK